MRKILLAAFAGALLTISASAQQSGGSRSGAAAKSEGDLCQEAGSNVEITACLDRLFRKRDAELNVVYRQALDAIPRKSFPEDPKVRADWQKTIRDTQRGWVAYKDGRCKGEVPFQWYGGTGASAASLGCLVALTEKRIEELKEALN